MIVPREAKDAVTALENISKELIRVRIEIAANNTLLKEQNDIIESIKKQLEERHEHTA